MRLQQWKAKPKKFLSGSSCYVKCSVTSLIPVMASLTLPAWHVWDSDFSQARASESWILPLGILLTFLPAVWWWERWENWPPLERRVNSLMQHQIYKGMSCGAGSWAWLFPGQLATPHLHHWRWFEIFPFSHVIHNVCRLQVFNKNVLWNWNDRCTHLFLRASELSVDKMAS